MSQYIRGRYFEYLTKKWLEREGYYVIRSAGSHGIFDLVAFTLLTTNTLKWEEDFILNNLLDRISVIGFQCKSIPTKLFEDVYSVMDFLSSKEFAKLRQTKFSFQGIAKFVFVYDSQRRKEIPQIWWYNDSQPINGPIGWYRLQ